MSVDGFLKTIMNKILLLPSSQSKAAELGILGILGAGSARRGTIAKHNQILRLVFAQGRDPQPVAPNPRQIPTGKGKLAEASKPR